MFGWIGMIISLDAETCVRKRAPEAGSTVVRHRDSTISSCSRLCLSQSLWLQLIEWLLISD